MPNQKYARLTLVLCGLAAVFYNSWPLGYLLDSQTAHYGLASDLEKAGHPYYQVFILGDILTGVTVLIISWLIRFKLWPGLRSKTRTVIWVGLLLFGLFTAMGAGFTPDCSVTPAIKCGVGNTHGLGLDGLFSGLAALGLFLGLAGVALLNMRSGLNLVLTRVTQIVLIGWSTSAIIFVILATTNGKAHLMQQLFLVLAGLALLAIGTSLGAVSTY
jgi:hypothetical protein